MSNLPITRRSALMSFGALGLAAAIRPSTVAAQQPVATAGSAPSDFDIFNFALNLESLEAEYFGWRGRC